MERPIIIIGAGGHAKVLLDTLLNTNKKVLGIIDKQLDKKTPFNIPILGTDEKLLDFSPDSIKLVNAIGSVENTLKRAQVFNCFSEKGYEFANVIHPSAILSKQIKLGQGIQVMAGTVLQTDCNIGDNTIVNTRASLDHDCSIGPHVHVAPGVVLSGGVTVGKGSHIGTGAIVIQGIDIGVEATVGAGAIVLNNVPNGATVVGVPAKEV